MSERGTVADKYLLKLLHKKRGHSKYWSVGFDYTADEDMLPWNHLDPDEINDLPGPFKPVDITNPPF